MKKCVFNTIFASYIYIYCYAHCSSSSISILVLQDLNLIWATLMSSQRAKQLLSADWSYNILCVCVCVCVCVLVNEKGGGGSWKKCDMEGEGFKKMYFCTNIFFESPLFFEINNFLNFKSKSNIAWNVKPHQFLSHNSFFKILNKI